MAEFMTVEEVAAYLRLSKKTIYRLLWQGNIPAAKIGHQWRFNKAYIDKWARQKSIRRGATILIVDDEHMIRKLFKETLEEQGHRVITAKDGSEGLELVKQLDLDMVFLDLKMKVMGGAEVFRQTKSIKPNLPVVIITGYPESDMMARALAYGPFAIMNKPFRKEDIIMAADSFLQTGKERVEKKLRPRSQL